MEKGNNPVKSLYFMAVERKIRDQESSQIQQEEEKSDSIKVRRLSGFKISGKSGSFLHL